MKSDLDIEFINSENVKNSINRLANSIRAERNTESSFLEIFADPKIIDRLKNNNNQIVYGRRGSGKTHLLLALAEAVEDSNTSEDKTIPIFIDLRKLLPLLTETDTSKIEASVLIFQHIINEVVKNLLDNLKYIFNIEDIFNESSIEKAKKSQIGNILEKLNCEFDGKTITKLGDIKFSKEEVKKISGSLNVSRNPSISGSSASETKGSHSSINIKYISFREVSEILTQMIELLNNVKVLCLLDEWSELPINLQPYVSELLKRTFIASHFTLKIAAIPYRSKFRDNISIDHKMGLEEGGDIFAVNLDNRYIFEINKNVTRDFYNELLFKHLCAINDEIFKKTDPRRFINIFFANQALSEILIASAGIPRDFMHLFILSYNLRSNTKQRIILKNIRSATTEWYNSDKKEEIEKDSSIRILFEAIVDKIVIGKNKTHFLMPQKYSENRHIKKLVDLRALHIRQKGISHKHFANKLYDAYSVDYGSYTSIDIQKHQLDTDFSNLKIIENVRDARSISLEDEFFEKYILEIGEGVKCPKCCRIVDTNHLAYIKQKLCNNCYEKIEESNNPIQ